MKTLLIVNFELGDATYPYWDISVTVEEPIGYTSDNYATLRERIISYCKNNVNHESYEDIVIKAMDDSGLTYEMVAGRFTCDCVIQMYI